MGVRYKVHLPDISFLTFSFKLENAAKFRAVEQKVGSYEEFKGIVDGCHLKPLDKKEEIDSILKPNKHDWSVAKENVCLSNFYLSRLKRKHLFFYLERNVIF